MPPDTAPTPASGPAGRGAILALGLLTLVYCFAFVDRQILNLMVSAMRRDFAISDAQSGYLLGPAFTFSYVAFGLPAGWCADRVSRKRLLVLAGTVWGLATAAAAFVTTYEQLFATRMVVGASEAFLFPAGMSLIADLFARRHLPVANSVFLASPYVGGGFALIGGGLLLDATQGWGAVAVPGLSALFGPVRGWQMTFLVVGLAGIVPVLLLPIIREPARGGRDAAADSQLGFGSTDDRPLPLRKGLQHFVAGWRFYAMFFLGAASASLVMTTVSAWAPTYLERAFGIGTGRIGVSYGAIMLVCGLAGGILGPTINALAFRGRDANPMRTVCLAPLLHVLAGAILLLAPDATTAMAALAIVTFAYSFPLSLLGASLQMATPSRLRGLASAIYFIIGSLVGQGLGPVLVPLLTRAVLHDERAVGTALALVAIGFGLVAFVVLMIAARAFAAKQTATQG